MQVATSFISAATSLGLVYIGWRQTKIEEKQQQIAEQQFTSNRVANFVSLFDHYTRISSSLKAVQTYYYAEIAKNPTAWEGQLNTAAGKEKVKKELEKLEQSRHDVLHFFKKYVILKLNDQIDPGCDRRFPSQKQLENFEANKFLDKANCIINLPNCNWPQNEPQEYKHVKDFIAQKQASKAAAAAAPKKTTH